MPGTGEDTLRHRFRLSLVLVTGESGECAYCVCQAKYWSDHKSEQDAEETRGSERQLLGKPTQLADS